MKKTYCLIAQVALLLWFFLDMTGLYLGDMCLVTRSYTEDGIFFVIYLIAMIMFFVKEKYGKWFVIIFCQCGLPSSLSATNGIPFLMMDLWGRWREKLLIFPELYSGFIWMENISLMYIIQFCTS